MRTLLILALSAIFATAALGCLDYDVYQGDDDTTPQPPEDDDVTEDDDTVPEEICDGEDNDGDGLVDEDFHDYDGDGIADCVDDDCDVDAPPTDSVAIDPECEGMGTITVKDPWNVAIEWQYTVGSGNGSVVMPAVGNLTDDNGDGQIDENDMPDIAFTVYGGNNLVALHGDGSGTIFDVSGFNGIGGVTIADVDNDGDPEVVAANNSNQVVAVDGAGNVEWTSQTFSWSTYPQPAVADMEGDGDVEIVFDIAVVEGSDGSTVTTLSGVTTAWRTPVIADIDDDGLSEIILGEDVFDHMGNLEWTSGSGGSGNFAAVADIDGDSGGEVFMVTGSQMRIHDSDGSVINTVTIPGSNPGPPAVADFDGDGDVEIAMPANTTFSVWETDGTQNWTQNIQDNSGLCGCSGYDVDGDGAYEVLYADEVRFRIFDGNTGTILYENTSHSSGTLWEYPVTADVDNDGSAEIVISSNGSGYRGVTVFGHDGDGWAKSGPTWGTHDFAVSNLEQDNSVPSPAPLSWQVHNVFRARPTVDNPGIPDLVPFLEDYCIADCIDGPIKISTGVYNQGGMSVGSSNTPAALYGIEDGLWTLLDTSTVDPVLAGISIPGPVFTMTLDQWADGFAVCVDDGGSGFGLVDECDEDNNCFEYYENICGM